jgi:hypothetical protein
MSQTPTTTNATLTKKYIPWGNPTNTPINSNRTRLYYKNINGVGTRNMSNGFVNLYSHMKTTGSSISCFTEPNLDWKQYWIKQTNEDHGRKILQNPIFAYSCHNAPAPNAYKPGGTMMATTGLLASRHLETKVDPSGMGRYSYQTFAGSNGTKIMFITAYRVCFQIIENAGEKTSFYHQWHNLLQQGHEYPNPRKQILLDLKELVLTSIGRGYDVCISMDANEELDSRNHQFSEWAEQCGLISVHEEFYDINYYDSNPIPSTFERGENKIDYILCTPRLFSCIESVSIEPMNAGTVSDHRALIVDFNTEKLLGQTLNIAKNKSRVLQSNNRQSSRHYRNELHHMLSEQNIFERVDAIVRVYEKFNILSKRSDHQAEVIDKYISDCMIKAESSIRTYNNDDFSPEKVKRADMEKFWKMAKQANRKMESIPTLPMTELILKYPQESFGDMESPESIQEQLKLCRESYKQAKENSKELRQSFLTERAEIAHLNGNITSEAAILQLKQIEAITCVYASLRRVMNPSEYRAGLSMIKVPTEDGTFVTVVDPKEIEERLLERNRQHYGQAEHTEMASEQVRTLLGTSGTSEFCDDILKGTADLSTMSPSLRAIFQQLEHPSNVEIDDAISYDDFKDALKCWKEKTSTSPSGRHLGHYISLMTKIGDDTDQLGETILELHHKMLKIAQYRRKPFERWKKETEVMLEKDPGDPKIDRLRIICLYEADYNLYLKIMWAHRLVKIAEKHNLFDDSQSGGRPRRTSNDVALRKMLVYSHSRITRSNFASMDLDAKSCFDRIMATFGMLCSRYFGMPKSACELHGLTIAGMQHHVKTALGISSAFFQSTPEKVLYGSGQGSSRSPTLWMTISIILFRALEARIGRGANFSCPRRKNTTHLTTEAWVDDSNDYVNDFISKFPWSEQQLCAKLCKQNQEWECLLSVSGGKLELPKCLAYIVVYDFIDSEPTQRPKDRMTSHINIKDTETGEMKRIEIKDPKESHKTLGTHQNPAGNPTGQIQTLALKEERMRKAFLYMSFPMYRVHLAYHSMYTKSLQFTLGVTLMSYEAANKLSKRTTRAIIGAMKINRSSPRVLAFAPKELLGLGMCHHYTAQGKMHIKQIIQHVRQQDENGKMYSMIFDYAQLLAGTQFPILQHPDRRLPHVQEPLIVTIRQFLSRCKINIVITKLYIPGPLRANDVNLTNAVMAKEKNNAAICRFNQVRLYLQVTWLSEICNVQGNRILPEYLDHTDRTETNSQSMLRWPIQGLPPKKSWTQWKYLIRKVFIMSKSGRLTDTSIESKLGNFFPTTDNHRRWKWEITGQSTIVENVFVFGLYRQKHYQIQHERTTRQYFSINTNEFSMKEPNNTVGYPLQQHHRNNDITTFLKPPTHHQHYDLRKKDNPPVQKFTNNLVKFMDSRSLDQLEIVQMPNKRMTIGVASKQWGDRTDFGWSLCFRNENESSFFGCGAGSVEKTSSYSERIFGELYATRAALNHLRVQFESIWTTQQLKITVLSANQATLTTLEKLHKTKTHNPRWRLNRNWELLHGIMIDLNRQPLTLKIACENCERHVKSLEVASITAIMYQERHPNLRPKLQSIQSFGRAYLRKGYEIINENFDAEISLLYTWPDFSKHLMKKFNWSSEVMKSINWDPFRHEAKKLNVNRRTNLFKFVYEWLPIGKVLQKIDPKASTKCPSCDSPIEAPDHMFCCTKAERQEITNACISQIIERCNTWKVRDDLTQALQTNLSFWTAHPTIQPPTAHLTNTDLRNAMKDQSKIGWGNFFKGWISTKIQQLVNEKRTEQLNQFEKIRWTCEIINIVWESERDHWNHRNKDKHGHTQEEEEKIKRDNLLKEAHEVFLLKAQIEPRYRSKLFQSWNRIKSKRSANLEIWIETTKQSVHYLLNVNKQADDDPPLVNQDTHTPPPPPPPPPSPD